MFSTKNILLHRRITSGCQLMLECVVASYETAISSISLPGIQSKPLTPSAHHLGLPFKYYLIDYTKHLTAVLPNCLLHVSYYTRFKLRVNYFLILL